MPEMDGIETISEIRSRSPDISIIAISGGGQLEPQVILESAKLLGADVSLAKPFRNSSLQSAVRELLKKKSGKSRGQSYPLC